MTTTSRLVLLLLSAAALSTASAQPPSAPRGPMGAGPAGDPAAFLLARTGELKLTDAQVTRLAAIARRADDRRRATMSQLDSLRARSGPPAARDSAARAAEMARVRPMLERLREQQHADLRDALAVLTADQQATAWELVAGGPFGGRGPGAPAMRARSGPSRDGRGGADRHGGGRGRRPSSDGAPSRPPSP